MPCIKFQNRKEALCYPIANHISCVFFTNGTLTGEAFTSWQFFNQENMLNFAGCCCLNDVSHIPGWAQVFCITKVYFEHLSSCLHLPMLNIFQLTDMIMWFWSINLSVVLHCISLIDLCMLSHPETHIRDKSHLVMMHNLMYYWIWFADIFLRFPWQKYLSDLLAYSFL